jgi:sugar phosphate isomerase/epimerase
MTPAGRLSLNQVTIKHLSIEEAVRACAEAGIPGIGLWRDRVEEAGTRAVAGLTRAAGLTVTSLCRGGFFTAATPQARAAALAGNRAAVDQAAEVGAPVLVLVCGGLPDRSRDLPGALGMVTDAIAELAPYAASHGVRLAIEPLHPMFCADRSVISTTAQALDIAGQFPATQVGVMVDAYHVWWDPGIEAALARAAGRIAGFQLSDWVLPLPADVLLGRGHIGDGCIDFRGLDQAVRDAGYDGWTEVEIMNADVWAAPVQQTLSLVSNRYRRHVTGRADPLWS